MTLKLIINLTKKFPLFKYLYLFILFMLRNCSILFFKYVFILIIIYFKQYLKKYFVKIICDYNVFIFIEYM